MEAQLQGEDMEPFSSPREGHVASAEVSGSAEQPASAAPEEAPGDDRVEEVRGDETSLEPA